MYPGAMPGMTSSSAGTTTMVARPRPYGTSARPRVRSQRTIIAGLHLLDLVLTQQAAGPHHQHEHDEHERDGVAKLRHCEADGAVDDAEQESADDGAGEAGESAHHGRRECL